MCQKFQEGACFPNLPDHEHVCFHNSSKWWGLCCTYKRNEIFPEVHSCSAKSGKQVSLKISDNLMTASPHHELYISHKKCNPCLKTTFKWWFSIGLEHLWKIPKVILGKTLTLNIYKHFVLNLHFRYRSFWRVWFTLWLLRIWLSSLDWSILEDLWGETRHPLLSTLDPCHLVILSTHLIGKGKPQYVFYTCFGQCVFQGRGGITRISGALVAPEI